MTRSPTVRFPAEMPWAVRTMAAAREALSTTFWPQLRALRLICVFRAAPSYSAAGAASGLDGCLTWVQTLQGLRA